MKHRNSRLYRLLLFGLCVFAFAQLLPNLRGVQYKMVYGTAQVEDYYHSREGMGGRVEMDIAQLTHHYITEQMSHLEPDFVYEISGKRGSFTNEKPGVDIFTAYPHAVRILGDQVYYGTAFPKDLQLPLAAEDMPDMTVGWTESTLAQTRTNFQAFQKEMDRSPYMVALFGFLLVGSFLELANVTGRRADGKVHLSAIDGWPTEWFIVFLLPSVFLLFVIWTGWVDPHSYQHFETVNPVGYLLMVGIFAFALSIVLVLVRKLKTGRLLRDTLVFRLFSGIWGLLRGKAENLARTERTFTLAVRYVFLSALIIILWQWFHWPRLWVGLALIAGAVLFLYLLRASLQVSADSVRTSVEERVKSERLKVDLVTNVSHDLNTPLTSIIGYVDLLQDEDMSPAAEEYTEILRQKSLRLKGIVSDLFDLSKSTSGAIELVREHMDYRVLIRQTLSDMQDAISESGREIVVKLPEEKVPIYADGMQLYRVLQNLLCNAIRYSLEGTRIFLRLEIQEDSAHLTLKNVSAYPLDFDKEEILSRFVRGDLARTTDGSGLGLAIAKSFTENNEGSFQVFAEEDVFIAMQTLKLVEKEKEESRA